MVSLQALKQRFEIIGDSIGLNRALEKAMQVAPTDTAKQRLAAQVVVSPLDQLLSEVFDGLTISGPSPFVAVERGTVLYCHSPESPTLPRHAFDQHANCHPTGKCVGVDDDIRANSANLGERHVLVRP